MIKKLITNFKISLILLIIAFGYLWYSEGINEAKILLTEYWWVWILIPIGLRFFNWFQGLKQKAFNYGSKSSERNIERMATLTDKATNTSKKRYEKLSKDAAFSKAEAEKIIQTRTEDSINMEIEISKDNAFFIPLYRYKKGLPGQNLVRSSTIDSSVVAGKIKSGNIEFFQCELKDYDGSINTNKLISKIPVGSIMKIEIVDLEEGRIARKVGGHLTDKAAKTIVRTMTPGVRAEKQFVAAASLNLHYINEDGLIIKAEFEFPSKCTFGKTSIEKLYQLKKIIHQFDLVGKLNWDAVTDLAEDIDDTIDLDEVSALAGEMITITKWMNLLSNEDSAILSAKMSAEMIAGIVQDSSVELIQRTE
ncbi:MAG: hypothetical protein HWE21_09035 [Cytophagia bacterium]|nr:hypothetical protein [Cytophagia bacterium]